MLCKPRAENGAFKVSVSHLFVVEAVFRCIPFAFALMRKYILNHLRVCASPIHASIYPMHTVCSQSPDRSFQRWEPTQPRGLGRPMGRAKMTEDG